MIILNFCAKICQNPEAFRLPDFSKKSNFCLKFNFDNFEFLRQKLSKSVSFKKKNYFFVKKKNRYFDNFEFLRQRL